MSLGDSALQQSAFFLLKLFMELPTFCCQNKKHFVTSEPLLAKVFFSCLHYWDQFNTNCITDGKKWPQVVSMDASLENCEFESRDFFFLFFSAVVLLSGTGWGRLDLRTTYSSRPFLVLNWFKSNT